MLSKLLALQKPPLATFANFSANRRPLLGSVPNPVTSEALQPSKTAASFACTLWGFANAGSGSLKSSYTSEQAVGGGSRTREDAYSLGDPTRTGHFNATSGQRFSSFVPQARGLSTHSGTPQEKADVVVIGAGVVGLAIARRLALSGREVLILEADSSFGTGTSSRNSEVIHGGLYYEVGSLKARLCVEGKEMLYSFAKEHDVNYKQIGKLVVACQDHEIPKLKKIHETAEANGVRDIEWITPSEAKNLEPNVHCCAAFLSKSTGVIDSHGLMAALLAEAEAHGAVLATNSTVTSGAVSPSGIMIEVTDSHDLHHAEGEPVLPMMQLNCKSVINAAGLDAQAIAKKLAQFPPDLVPRRYLARGNYFSFSGAKSPFSRLVYPIPPGGGLGVHVTVDLGGQCKFGPDVEWLPEDVEHPIASYDYTVDPSRMASFYSAIRTYFPELPDGSLEPAYSGIRPKLFGPNKADVGSNDFVIQGPTEHGVPGLINLFGIESPGLTSCLAIAERVYGKLQ